MKVNFSKGSFFALGVFFVFLIAIAGNAKAQTQLKRTNTINACVKEYIFGTPSTDDFVIVAFTCNNLNVANSWTPPQGLTELTEMLIIAGGGGGGKRSDTGNRGAGGGGAGQLIHITNSSQLEFQVSNSDGQGQTLDIFVGNGGAGSSLITSRGSNGQNTTVMNSDPLFNNVTAFGGGGGGSANSAVEGNNGNYIDQRRGNRGGSGGGSVGSYGTGAANQIDGGEAINVAFGKPGGNGRGNNSVTGGGGGGGIGGPGEEPANNNSGAQGGLGRGATTGFYTNLLPNTLPNEIPRMFAAGGGGVAGNPGSGAGDAGEGGSGVGGNAVVSGNGQAGRTNTGSGGGAGGSSSLFNTFTGGRGGNGLVLIRYDFARILPVEYGDYNLEVNNKSRSVLINWSTLKETENDFFEIQRSLNGIDDFVVVGMMEGQGWTNSETSYQFEDDNLPLYTQKAYYRLVQVGFSGKRQVGKVLLANLDRIEKLSGSWQAYPNPSRGENLKVFPVDENISISDQVEVQLTHSGTGFSFSFQSNNLQQLNKQIQENSSQLPKGVLLLRLSWDQSTEVIRLLKQ